MRKPRAPGRSTYHKDCIKTSTGSRCPNSVYMGLWCVQYVFYTSQPTTNLFGMKGLKTLVWLGHKSERVCQLFMNCTDRSSRKPDVKRRSSSVNKPSGLAERDGGWKSQLLMLSSCSPALSFVEYLSPLHTATRVLLRTGSFFFLIQ